MILIVLIILHLLFLHNHGRLINLRFKNNIEYIKFHPKFSLKDSLTVGIIILILVLLSIIYPYDLIDPENFIIANPLTTPTHIQPE